MTILGQLAILALEVVLAKLLQPHAKRPHAPELDVPSTEDGTPIVQGYGTFPVSPNIAWWGHNKLDDAPSGNTFYHANLITPLCLGPIDKLVDIQCGGKSLRLHPVVKSDSTGTDATATLNPDLNPDGYTFTADSTEIVIQARQLFGGEAREGGIEGTIRFHRGSLSDSVDAMTTLSHGADQASAWPGICYAVIGTAQVPAFYLGTVAQPKPFVFILQFIPNALGLGAIGQDANPAEILWDLHVHKLRGAGLSESLLDRQSFIDGGTWLRDKEQLGLSPVWTSETELQDMIDDVQNHARCYVYEHPETGLRTLKLLRAQDLTGIPVVDRSVASDLEVTWPSWRQTTNEVKVKYRKFDFSALTNQTVTNEPLTPSSGLAFSYGGFAIYQCNGRDISLVTVHNVTKSADVSPSNYKVNTNSGVFVFRPLVGVLEPGDVLTVSYTSGSDPVGYIDDTKVAQDLANIQRTRELRTQTYDCPFFTREIPAQAHAAYLLKISGNLARATWTQNRTGHAQYPGDVVPVTWEPLDQDGNPDQVLVEKPFRITKVTEVPETDELKFEAIEDVFGADLSPAIPSGLVTSTSSPLTCPRLSIGCGIGGSNVRIAFFPSDTNFTIRLWQADDADGTNRVLVDDYVGTTAYYDTATTGKYYQAQLVRTNWADGPLTDYITCTPSGGSPSAPVCSLPTVATVPDFGAGTLTLTVYDTQTRVPSDGVMFRHRSGNGEFTDWAAATLSGGVYTDTVTLDDVYTSRIEWQVTYQDCAGNDDAVFTGGQDYSPGDADPDPVPFPGLTQTPIVIPFLLTDTPRRFWGIPSDNTVVAVQEKFPLGQFRSIRPVVVVTGTSLPEGAAVAFEFENPSLADDWHPLAESGGPDLALDATALSGLLGKAVDGGYVSLRDEAQDDVRLRAVLNGCDGDDAKYVAFTRIELQAIAQDVANAPPPETTTPAPYDPGSCDTPSTLDAFAYANTAALDAAWAEG